jgi:hypothetical protein
MDRVYVLTELQKVDNTLKNTVIGVYNDLLDACNEMNNQYMQYNGVIKCTQLLQRAIKFEEGGNIILLKVESFEIK